MQFWIQAQLLVPFKFKPNLMLVVYYLLNFKLSNEILKIVRLLSTNIYPKAYNNKNETNKQKLDP